MAKKTVLPEDTGAAFMDASNSVTGLMLTVAFESTVSCSSTNWLLVAEQEEPAREGHGMVEDASTWVRRAATSTTSLSTRVVTVVRKKLKNSPTSDMTTFSPERKDRRLR